MKLQKRTNKSGTRYYLQTTVKDGGRNRQIKVAMGGDKKTAETRAIRFLATYEKDGLVAAQAELVGEGFRKKTDPVDFKTMKNYYRSLQLSSPEPVRERTFKENVNALKRIMDACDVKTVEKLATVDVRGLMLPPDASDAQRNGFNTAIRCARSIFKPEALAFYSQGYTNPKGKHLDAKGEKVKDLPPLKIANPLASVSVLRPQLKRYQPLSVRTREAVMADCVKELPPAEAMIVLLGIHCGLRRSEVAACRLSWWSEQEDCANLQIGDATFKTKSGQERNFDVSSEVYEQLLKLREAAGIESDFFVPSKTRERKGANVEKTRLWGEFNRVTAWLKSKGVDGTQPFHRLRKEAATALLRECKDLNTVQEFLGHSEPGITAKIYTRAGKAVVGAKAKTPEQAFAESLGITVEQLRAKLGNTKNK